MVWVFFLLSVLIYNIFLLLLTVESNEDVMSLRGGGRTS